METFFNNQRTLSSLTQLGDSGAGERGGVSSYQKLWKSVQLAMPLVAGCHLECLQCPHLLVRTAFSKASPWVWPGFSDLLQANRMWQRRWMSFLRLGYKKDCLGRPLWLICSLALSKASCVLLWVALWREAHVTRNWYLWPTDPSPANSHRSALGRASFPSRPQYDHIPGQYLDCKLVGDPEQRHPAKSCLNFWPSETIK